MRYRWITTWTGPSWFVQTKCCQSVYVSEYGVINPSSKTVKPFSYLITKCHSINQTEYHFDSISKTKMAVSIILSGILI